MKLPATLRWRLVPEPNHTLGRGAHAHVVLVEDKQDEFAGRYALKGFAPRKGTPTKILDRFFREIETIKRLDSRSIVKIVDHSQPTDEFQFYAMEYHEGANSLKQLMDLGTNPFFREPLKAIKFFRQLIEAFDLWSKAGVVHRDLGPANVLVLPNEEVLVIDFGVCQLNDGQAITVSGEGVGTPNYMAPECEAGSSEAATSAADIYSIGKLLWTAITNRPVFGREEAVFNSLSLNSEFPDEWLTWHLHHLFEGTIRRNPSSRFSSAEAALSTAAKVEFLIRGNYLPLELLRQWRCATCGFGTLRDFPMSHLVFGNPMPPGIVGLQCDYCGECAAINSKKRREALELRSELF